MFSVYRNLHNNLLSIKDYKSGLVIGHCSSVSIENATFKVSEKGVKKIRRENKKYVVATVSGTVTDIVGFKPYKERKKPFVNNKPFQGLDSFTVLFNPYKHDSFIKDNKDKTPVHKADYVFIDRTGFIKAFKRN